jgi:hypothetical protein
MSNAGLVYLLMLRVKCPLGAREIADTLGIHEQTAASYLRRLAKLNLVARSRRKQGYVLLGGSQLILEQVSQVGPPEIAPPEKALPSGLHITAQAAPQEAGGITFFSQNPVDAREMNAAKSAGPPVEISQDQADIPADSTKITQFTADTTKKTQYPVNNNINKDMDIKLINNINDSEELLLIIDDTSKNSQYGVESEHADVWQELFAAGINRNPRTRALVSQPYITAEYVRAHRQNQEASGMSGPKWAGLLVTILESGAPAPELNPNGHLGDCMCLDCHGYRISQSWADP